MNLGLVVQQCIYQVNDIYQNVGCLFKGKSRGTSTKYGCCMWEVDGGWAWSISCIQISV